MSTKKNTISDDFSKEDLSADKPKEVPMKTVAGASMKALINAKQNVRAVTPKNVKAPARPTKTPVKQPAKPSAKAPARPPAKVSAKAPVKALAKNQNNTTPKPQVKLSASIPTKTITKISEPETDLADNNIETPVTKISELDSHGSESESSESNSLKTIMKPKSTSKKDEYKSEDFEESDEENKKKSTNAKKKASASDSKSEKDDSNSGNANIKGPGRPRKNPQVDNLPLQGVVNKPDSDKNKMEMRYGNPASLKKIFMLLKAMDPEELHMYFEKDKFTIKARDHLEKSNIYVVAYGKNMNKYYCEKPFAISLESEAIAKIFQTMDNTHHAIQFISRKRAGGDDLNMYIIMIDRVRNRHDNYEIKVKGGSIFQGLNKEVNCKNYPIQFTLDSKDFKKTISKIGLHTDKFTIQKKGDEDLRISTQQSKKTGVKCNFVYKDAEDIKLISKVKKNDLFSVAINIKYIKNISKSQLGEFITIRADSFDPTVFEIDLDYCEENKSNTFHIVISTETFKYKAIKD